MRPTSAAIATATSSTEPNIVMATPAFAVASPAIGTSVWLCAPSALSIRQGPPRRAARKQRHAVRACTPPDGAPPKTLTKAQEIAALLGRDPVGAKAEAQRVRDVAQKDARYRYGLAIASVCISTGLFVMQRLDPEAPLALMSYMQSNSAPIEIVGTNGNPTLVEFGATWCENCKTMARGIFELENEFSGAVNFVILDGEDSKNADLLDRFGVDGIPHIVVLDADGATKANLIGKVPKRALSDDLRAVMDKRDLPYPGIDFSQMFPDGDVPAFGIRSKK